MIQILEHQHGMPTETAKPFYISARCGGCGASGHRAESRSGPGISIRLLSHMSQDYLRFAHVIATYAGSDTASPMGFARVPRLLNNSVTGRNVVSSCKWCMARQVQAKEVCFRPRTLRMHGFGTSIPNACGVSVEPRSNKW